MLNSVPPEVDSDPTFAARLAAAFGVFRGRAALALIAASVAALVAPLPAHAAWPEKPIRFIVPSAAGGSPDVLMRVMAIELSRQMGVPVVVDNKPGASFTIGTAEIARAAPDGYTLGYGNIVSLAVVQTLLPSVPYDVDRDLTLVSNTVRVFNLLAVNNALPVRTVPELIAYNAQMMVDNISSIGPHAKSGRVRGIAVSGPRRSPVFPDLPTVAEAGVPGYETVAWGGVIGPAGLPREVMARLAAEIRKALAVPALVD